MKTDHQWHFILTVFLFFSFENRSSTTFHSKCLLQENQEKIKSHLWLPKLKVVEKCLNWVFFGVYLFVSLSLTGVINKPGIADCLELGTNPHGYRFRWLAVFKVTSLILVWHLGFFFFFSETSCVYLPLFIWLLSSVFHDELTEIILVTFW